MHALARVWARLEEGLIAFLLAAMTLVTFVYVVLNNLYTLFYDLADLWEGGNETLLAIGDAILSLAQEMTWSNALTKALFAWLIFLGIAYGVRTAGHLGVDVLVKLASRPVQRVLGVIACLACLGYAGLLCVASYDWVKTLFIAGIGAEDLDHFGILQAYIAVVVPVGFGLVLGSVSLGVMRATALVQPTSANAMVFPLALTLEALLFSLALASRIQDLKQERALALDQADQEKNARLALLHSAQRDLARAVEVRTNELSEANRQLQMREAQLQYAAHHDPLTGLGNRRHLMEFAESALDDARRHGNSMALLLIDLDHFKPINDTHGHDAGDFVLQNVAQRLRHCVRTEDCVARLGGDEFAVLVGGSNAEQHARDIAERLLRELAKPVEFAKQWLVITPSIGVALFPGDALQFGKLYKAADQALYRVKGAGRAGYAMAADDERETAPALPWPTALAPERIS